jgi:hypothetical protein
MRPGSARASGSGNTATRAADAGVSRGHRKRKPRGVPMEAAGLPTLGTGPSERPVRPAYCETALNAFTWPWPLNEL